MKGQRVSKKGLENEERDFELEATERREPEDGGQQKLFNCSFSGCEVQRRRHRSVWGGRWLGGRGCISEPSGGKGHRRLDSLSEGGKRKTQVKGGAQMKGLSDRLLQKVEEGWQKPFRA